jgi:hypothetical protein
MSSLPSIVALPAGRSDRAWWLAAVRRLRAWAT